MDSTNAYTATALPTKESAAISDNTKTTLKETVKSFGRYLYKLPLEAVKLTYHIPAIATEVVSGSVGAVAGTVIGGIKILARKCRAHQGDQKLLSLDTLKQLKDSAVNGFHLGAQIGRIPGKALGVVTASAYIVSVFTSILTLPMLAIPLYGATIAGGSLLLTAVDFVDIKQRGVKHADNFSTHINQASSNVYNTIHNKLYGAEWCRISGDKDLPLFSLSALRKKNPLHRG